MANNRTNGMLGLSEFLNWSFEIFTQFSGFNFIVLKFILFGPDWEIVGEWESCPYSCLLRIGDVLALLCTICAEIMSEERGCGYIGDTV